MTIPEPLMTISVSIKNCILSPRVSKQAIVTLTSEPEKAQGSIYGQFLIPDQLTFLALRSFKYNDINQPIIDSSCSKDVKELWAVVHKP